MTINSLPQWHLPRRGFRSICFIAVRNIRVSRRSIGMHGRPEVCQASSHKEEIA